MRQKPINNITAQLMIRNDMFPMGIDCDCGGFPECICTPNFAKICDLQIALRQMKLDVLVDLRPSGKYNYNIFHYDEPNDVGRRTRYGGMNSFIEYDDALEAGLQQALQILINQFKKNQ